MKLSEKLMNFYYEEAQKTKEVDLKFYLYWNAFMKLCETTRFENDGLRQGIRRFIEGNYDALVSDVNFEDNCLDPFYERPVFEDGRVEEDKDVYYYQDFNTNKQSRSNDDYFLSIKNFQKITEDSDLIAFYMSMLKIYNYLIIKNEIDNDRDKRLIEASNYLLENGLKNLL